MEGFETISCSFAGPLATVTLTRPQVRNAMSQEMVEELLRCFTELRGEEHAAVRVVVLRAAGAVFCAGGDVKDLQNAGDALAQENARAIARTDEMLRAVNEAPQVVVARVQGAAMGGGLGLVCVSDVAIAGESASFALPEVRLGIAPALISPYVIARVGFTRARQLMLTGVRFGAEAALTYGLVHETCADAALDSRVDALTSEILRCAPGALRECKRLLFAVAGNPDTLAGTLADRVDTLNRLRAGAEAQQGMAAFLRKQPPPWAPQSQPST
jgi:enoyl-CoA hydratase/carnithine racemase